jgi:Uma2 family endonuclease
MDVLQKKLTWREFRQMEFDDNDPFWYELINGELVKKQSPTFDHQAISREIEFFLVSWNKQSKAGVVYNAPLDVVLDDGNCYHPDLLYIRKERFFILDKKERIVIGAPDMVVEILSKSTAADDKGIKKDNYEKFGVREYWLVDPQKKSFEIYSLVDERYRLTSYLEGNGVLKSIVLEGLEIEIETIFKDADLNL